VKIGLCFTSWDIRHIIGPIMAKNRKPVAVMENLARGIQSAWSTASIPQDIKQAMALKLCRDYPQLFKLLPQKIQLSLIEGMRTELKQFENLVQPSK
jgi:hypothetical protein